MEHGAPTGAIKGSFHFVTQSPSLAPKKVGDSLFCAASTRVFHVRYSYTHTAM